MTCPHFRFPGLSGARSCSNALANNHVLQILNLEGNNMDDQAGKFIFDGLSANRMYS